MNSFVNATPSVILMGIGATAAFDLWGLLLKHAFRIPPSNICLVGRWIRYMPDGIFIHDNIMASPGKRAECQVGWMAHYLIGITFASIFVFLAGTRWLEHPTAGPALTFGVLTAAAPFLIMQPAFGFGFAASRSANPAQARIRTLMNHVTFGVGLYFFGWSASWMV